MLPVSKAELSEDRIKITLVSHETDPSLVPSTLIQAGHRLLEFYEDEVGLEKVFLHVTKGETQ